LPKKSESGKNIETLGFHLLGDPIQSWAMLQITNNTRGGGDQREQWQLWQKTFCCLGSWLQQHGIFTPGPAHWLSLPSSVLWPIP